MDCTSAFRQWWDDLTREGDPIRIPNPCAKGFTAGWYACEKEHERQPTPADTGTARAIIAHMEQPQLLSCEDYDPDALMGEDYITGESMPLSLITREQGGHVRTL